MKKSNKIVSLILAVIMLFSIAMPAVFAEDAPAADPETTTVAEGYNEQDQHNYEKPLPEHPTFEEWYEYVTDGQNTNSAINWKKLPKAMFQIFFTLRFFEIILKFIREIFTKK